MASYLYRGVDYKDLFDSKIAPKSFKEHPRDHIRAKGSIIYTVWDKQGKWIYVGIGGLGRSSDTEFSERNPISRIRQHRSGRRAGDQFCVYVHDYYIVPKLNISKRKFEKGRLDRMTREFIQNELFYRFIVLQIDESNKLIRGLETELKKGVPGFGTPLLNGI